MKCKHRMLKRLPPGFRTFLEGTQRGYAFGYCCNEGRVSEIYFPDNEAGYKAACRFADEDLSGSVSGRKNRARRLRQLNDGDLPGQFEDWPAPGWKKSRRKASSRF